MKLRWCKQISKAHTILHAGTGIVYSLNLIVADDAVGFVDSKRDGKVER